MFCWVFMDARLEFRAYRREVLLSGRIKQEAEARVAVWRSADRAGWRGGSSSAPYASPGLRAVHNVATTKLERAVSRFGFE